ncbi:MAG: histidine phosphatase family protein [Patescibacteria group bacterium]
MEADRRVYVLRHGVTATNQRPDFIGGLEPQLEILPAGREQLEAAAPRLLSRDERIRSLKRIFVSPTLRAKQSAEAFAARAGMEVTLIEDDRLREIDMGDFTGKSRSEVFTPEVRASMDQLGEHYRPPRGTTRAELGMQMYSWLDSRTEALTLGVSHVNAIRALIHRVLGVHAIDPRSMQAWNGHAAVFDHDGKKWMFHGFNW